MPEIVEYAQKQRGKFVKFVHTSSEDDAIINIVKPPIHYIVFATPHKRNTFSKKDGRSAVFFLV